jgi:hypothetical protein
MVLRALIRAVDRMTPPDDGTIPIFTHDPTTGAPRRCPFVLIIH